MPAKSFFKDSSPLQDASLCPQAPITMVNATITEVAVVSLYNRLGGLLQVSSQIANVPLAGLLALWLVESSAREQQPNQATLRFENHLFFRRWGKKNISLYDQHFQHGGRAGITGFPWWNHRFRESANGDFLGFHGAQRLEYQVLRLACQLAGDQPALCSASIGAPQILLSHHRRLGYETAREMHQAFQLSERAQVAGLLDFLNHWPATEGNNQQQSRELAEGGLEFLRDFKWLEFARYYNGSGQAKKYAKRLQEAYQLAAKLVGAGRRA